MQVEHWMFLLPIFFYLVQFICWRNGNSISSLVMLFVCGELLKAVKSILSKQIYIFRQTYPPECPGMREGVVERS